MTFFETGNIFKQAYIKEYNMARKPCIIKHYSLYYCINMRHYRREKKEEREKKKCSLWLK